MVSRGKRKQTATARCRPGVGRTREGRSSPAGAKPRFAPDQATASDGRRGVGRVGSLSAAQSAVARTAHPWSGPCNAEGRTSSPRPVSKLQRRHARNASGPNFARRRLLARSRVDTLADRLQIVAMQTRKSPIIVRDSAHAPDRVKNATASARLPTASAGSRCQRWPEARPRTKPTVVPPEQRSSA